MNNTKLAERIANAVMFEVERIALMKRSGGDEKNMGGLCRHTLIGRIKQVLDDENPELSTLKSRPLKMGEIQSGTRVRHKTWPPGADELVTRTSEFGVYRWLIWTTWEQLAQDFQMWIEDRWIDCKVQE